MQIIKSAETVSFNLLVKEPVSTPTLSYVYKNPKEDYRLVKDGEQLTRTELWTKKYTIRYAVVRNLFDYKHEKEYPSLEPGKNFRVTMNITISVKDPVAVVKSEIHDLRNYLEANIPYWIQPIVEDYTIEDFKQVRTKIQNIDQHAQIRKKLEEKGFSVGEIRANVFLSKADWQHFQKIEELKKSHELKRLQLENERDIQKTMQQWKLEDEDIRIKREEEEKRKLLKAFQEGGFPAFVIQAASTSNEVLEIILKERNDVKAAYQGFMAQIMNENADPEDKLRMIKKMGEIFSVQQPLLEESKKEIEGESWDDLKRLVGNIEDSNEERED